MPGILSNAISGLQASQNALRTAGHNISNANTDGYSRQQVEYATRAEQSVGSAGFIGSGVSTVSIQRVVNEFVTAQLRLDTATFNQLETFDVNIGKVDSLLADVNTGLAGGLQTFFAAIQNAADDPSSTPARQLMIEEVNSLSVRFNNLQDRFEAIDKAITSEVSTITEQITSLAQSISDLNQAIGNVSSSGEGNFPNDLLDKREEALRELSELVAIQIVEQDAGDLNIFIGNGQPLVIGKNVSEFTVTRGGDIILANNIQSTNLTEQITGGKIGGLLSFREEVLHQSMNDLGRIAIVLADQFNTLQSEGVDLEGDYGVQMFADINDLTIARDRIEHGDNAPPSDRIMSLAIDDVSQLTTSDYSFRIAAGTNNYVVTRISDDTIVNQGMLNGSYPADISFDGLTVTLESGTFQGGDSFILKPTANGARDIAVAISRPEDLALAAPIRTGTDISNLGSGSIDAGVVLSLVDANGDRLPAFSETGELSPPIIIRFTSPNTYEVLDNTFPSDPQPLDPPVTEQTFIPGGNNALFTTDDGETFIEATGARLGLPAGRTAEALIIGAPAQNNGYPVEQLTFNHTDPDSGVTSSQVLITSPNASAIQTAALISSVPGVSANAYTTANITNVNITDFTVPLQISLNGENLLEYTTGALSTDIPDPMLDEAAFNDYLAERINENENLNDLGVRAISGSNAVTGRPEVRLVASSGVNLDIRLEASTPTNTMDVNDAAGNPDVQLVGSGIGNQSAVTVGGHIDITLGDGYELRTAPTNSQLFGDSTLDDFARSSYLGYQVVIKGEPEAGDTFTVGFNSDATNDNRNALRFAALETGGTIDEGSLSFSEAYGRLVEVVGTKSSLSRINTAASEGLLQQTQTLRDSVSGVNLDEEAANLILYEQVYNANARVISVARDIFDTLLQAI